MTSLSLRKTKEPNVVVLNPQLSSWQTRNKQKVVPREFYFWLIEELGNLKHGVRFIIQLENQDT